MTSERRHEIVVVGGGTAGMTVAAQLGRAGCRDVAVVEPSATHDYQPLWTLVGGGVVPKDASRRPTRSVLPKGAVWIKDAAREFDPEANHIVTAGGARVAYDFLVVAAGIAIRWDAVKGLREHVGSHGICTNYAFDQCDGTWDAIRGFGGGTAIFTMPTPPIKCAGAPQKIMYLADDHFRSRGVRDRSRVVYASATPSIFAVKEFARTLNQVVARRGIETLYRHELAELRPQSREAVFVDLERDSEVALRYDLIHVTPPQGPPDVVRRSPLADGAGWVEVDKHSLQHPRHPNVFALGDASSLPTSKTGAAIHAQAPVLVRNLLAARRGEEPRSRYDGYTSCPLVTGYGRLVLAEFDYDLAPKPTFPFIDPTKERWSMYQLKRRVLPFLYWNGMLRGRW